MWTALIEVAAPDDAVDATGPVESLRMADPSASMSGIDNSTQSGDDTNKGSQASLSATTTAITAPKSNKRRMDPVLLEMTEKRRSARVKTFIFPNFFLPDIQFLISTEFFEWFTNLLFIMEEEKLLFIHFLFQLINWFCPR